MLDGPAPLGPGKLLQRPFVLAPEFVENTRLPFIFLLPPGRRGGVAYCALIPEPTFCSRCGTAEDSPGRCPRCGASRTPGLTPLPLLTRRSPAPNPPITPDEDLTRDPSASGALPINSAMLRPGQRFGARYTIIRSLGSGGMGDVYQAWDESLGIAVALKTIKTDPTAPPVTARDLEERFKRELRLARQVSHPNVVRIHDLGELGALRYLTMAYVQGENLDTVLRTQGKLPLPRALAIGRQIAAGLAAAHEAGVVHRDLKPANVLIDHEQRALLTDFGIARAVDGGTVHTVPGAVVGTLAYMAPEQARGDVADQRSDVYAFGLILYSSLLAGGRERVARATWRISWRVSPKGHRAAAGGPGHARSAGPARRSLPGTGSRQAIPGCTGPARRPEPASPRRDARAIGSARRSRWKRAAAGLAVAGAIIAGTWWLAGPQRAPADYGAGAAVGPDRRLREQGRRFGVRRLARAGAGHRRRGRLLHHELLAEDGSRPRARTSTRKPAGRRCRAARRGERRHRRHSRGIDSARRSGIPPGGPGPRPGGRRRDRDRVGGCPGQGRRARGRRPPGPAGQGGAWGHDAVRRLAGRNLLDELARSRARVQHRAEPERGRQKRGGHPALPGGGGT